MTDAEREKLVERMAQRGCDRADPPGISTWSALSEVAKEEWRLDMRAALSVAEPVVREDEREACLAIVATWSRDGQSPTAHGIDEGIRARGAA